MKHMLHGRWFIRLCVAIMLPAFLPASVLASPTNKVEKTAAKRYIAGRNNSYSLVQRGGGAQRNHLKVSLSGRNSGLSLFSTSAMVVDQANGEVVVRKNADRIRPIASITKLMTAMVVLESGLDLQEIIRISEEDVSRTYGSRSRLPKGATMTRETALLLSLMSSDNRAAYALGRNYPGGVAAFAVAMNRKARALGMRNTFIQEPTGLSKNNISTAHDLAKMVAAANTFSFIRMATTIAEAIVKLDGRITSVYRNTNSLVRGSDWQIGISKTGYTRAAGRCLVMQATVAGRPMVIVLLDANGKAARLGDANRIRNWIEKG